MKSSVSSVQENDAKVHKHEEIRTIVEGKYFCTQRQIINRR